MTALRREEVDGGSLWRVVLDGPPGNILDGPAISGLCDMARQAADSPHLKAVLLCGAGKHFCFGASVDDHLPEKVRAFLPAFGAIFLAWAGAGVPLAAAVRGQCLGGGFELAAFCHFLFCDGSARFAQPEIALGVFAPVAAMLLPAKVGQARADDWMLSGRRIAPEEAQASGLVTARAGEGEDVEQVGLAWLRENLGKHSAFSLRHAARAARSRLDKDLASLLPGIESLYLDQLMAGQDPVDGLRAFVEKRPPRWVDR